MTLCHLTTLHVSFSYICLSACPSTGLFSGIIINNLCYHFMHNQFVEIAFCLFLLAFLLIQSCTPQFCFSVCVFAVVLVLCVSVCRIVLQVMNELS